MYIMSLAGNLSLICLSRSNKNKFNCVEFYDVYKDWSL